MTKEFGKLTSVQFAELIAYVPNLLRLIKEVGEHLADTPAEKFDAFMCSPYGNYCHIYESSFCEHLAYVSVVMNRHHDIHQMAASPDPQEAVLDVLRNLDKADDDRPLYEGFTESQALALIYSLGRSVTSMATYGRSISALLQEVRDKKDHESLFKAIRMDRSVIGCPTAMQLISRAQMRDNKPFFRRLRSALGGPDKKQWEALNPMRYAFLLLVEMGVHGLSEAELETLMVDVLKVYPRTPSARKNLRAQYQQYRKYTTI